MRHKREGKERVVEREDGKGVGGGDGGGGGGWEVLELGFPTGLFFCVNELDGQSLARGRKRVEFLYRSYPELFIFWT